MWLSELIIVEIKVQEHWSRIYEVLSYCKLMTE
jgi:hypothetical protein